MPYPAISHCLAAIAATAACFLTGSLSGAETVKVRLSSGRELTAAIDERTDDERLWLRYGTSSAILIRPVRWEQIAAAEHDGNSLSVEQLRELATASIQADAEAAAAQPDADDQGAESADEPEAGEAVETGSMAEQARRALAFAPQVRSVRFDAYLANWDRDVESDGIVLHLFPLDSNGQVTATEGVIHVEFVALRRYDFHVVPTSRGQRPERLGRWTVNVRAEDCGPDGAVVRLPFQTAHAEFDTDWAPSGLIHLRYVVPGQGVFEHSEDGIRTRPYSPLRDTLERNEGQRFLPSETTGRGRNYPD